MIRFLYVEFYLTKKRTKSKPWKQEQQHHHHQQQQKQQQREPKIKSGSLDGLHNSKCNQQLPYFFFDRLYV